MTFSFKDLTVTMTEAENKRSRRIGSKEYKQLMEYYQMFGMDLKIEIKKNKVRGMTQDEMREYVERNNSDLVEDFDVLISEKASYGELKKWFDSYFPIDVERKNKINVIINKAIKNAEERKEVA